MRVVSLFLSLRENSSAFIINETEEEEEDKNSRKK